MSKHVYGWGMSLAIICAVVAAAGTAGAEEPSVGLAWAKGFAMWLGAPGFNATTDPSGNLIVVTPPDPSKFQGPAVRASDASAVTKFASDSTALWSTPVNSCLVVDPTASAQYEALMHIGTDAEGNIYVAGETVWDYRLSVGVQGSTIYDLVMEICVIKLSPVGAVLWTRQFGRTVWETQEVTDIAVGPSGEVYVIGQTGYGGFPTTVGLDRTYGAQPDTNETSIAGHSYGEGFVTAFSPSGDMLWSTFVGGGGVETISGRISPDSGDLVVTGSTSSTDFPVVNAWQDTHGGRKRDLYVARLRTSSEGGRPGSLRWATYLGGNAREELAGASESLCVTQSGNAALTFSGGTGISISVGAFTDGYGLALFDAEGTLLWTRSGEDLYGDNPGAGSPKYPVFRGEDDTIYVGRPWGVMQIDQTGSTVGSGDMPTGAQFGLSGASCASGEFVFGSASSADGLPTPGGFQTARNASSDGYVGMWDSSGELKWASYLGGGGSDEILRVLSCAEGGYYVLGRTYSGWPFESALPGGEKVFAARIVTEPVRVEAADVKDGALGWRYEGELEAGNATAPCTWSVTGGALPSGLSLDTSTGVISGTPTAVGSWSFTVQVTDSSAIPRTATEGLSIAIVEDDDGPKVVDAASVPGVVREGVDLSATLVATADDSDTGGIWVTGAEYFLGAAGDDGTGTPMAAADGAFDSAAESVTASIDTSTWTTAGGDRLVSLRARDGLGNWGQVTTLTIGVCDATAPAAVSDLAVTATGNLTKIYSAAA